RPVRAGLVRQPADRAGRVGAVPGRRRARGGPMTAPAATGGRGKAAVWIGLAVAALIVVGFATRAEPEAALVPYSPESTDPSGPKALAELVRSFDATVDVGDGQPPSAGTVAFGLGYVVPDDEAAVA